jgi:hypothetical protein
MPTYVTSNPPGLLKVLGHFAVIFLVTIALTLCLGLIYDYIHGINNIDPGFDSQLSYVAFLGYIFFSIFLTFSFGENIDSRTKTIFLIVALIPVLFFFGRSIFPSLYIIFHYHASNAWLLLIPGVCIIAAVWGGRFIGRLLKSSWRHATLAILIVAAALLLIGGAYATTHRPPCNACSIHPIVISEGV